MTTALRLHRRLPYPPDRIWLALTDPGALAAWFWPAHFGTTVDVDLRVGGRFRIAGPNAGIAVGGEYVTVEAPHRLVFTWRWDGDPTETLVTLELTADGAATDLVVTHEGFADDTDRANHATGWSDCLDRLPGWLAGPTDRVTDPATVADAG
jgi:uncharacterized protein YndB with AHSA1/START domain